MSEYQEYYLPTTADDKAQIIHISNKNNIKIDNDEIQEFLNKIISKNRLSNFMFRAFILSAILNLIYIGYAPRMFTPKSRLMICGLFMTIIITIIFFIVAYMFDKKWSADELHIIPIKDYEFKDNNSKILCTTSCYSFEENATESAITNLYPVKYIQYDLKNGEIPYIEAYTYRVSEYFWMTIHLPEENQ